MSRSTKQQSLARARLVRENHLEAGGSYSTEELAGVLGLSESTVYAYLKNLVATNHEYEPPDPYHRLSPEAAVFLTDVFHLSKREIAKLYNCSVRNVNLNLSRKLEKQIA